MSRKAKWILIFFVLLFMFHKEVLSQTDFVIINRINVEGNKKTQLEAIWRELDISVNDTIPLEILSSKIEDNEKRLLSTGLFSSVKINVKNWDTETSLAELFIVVSESWYLYPYVIFELADRNFNVWAQEFNYSFERVNYGVALTHTNFTGRKDKLKAKLQFGYTKKYELFYEYPYLTDGWGMTGNVLYTSNKEINFQTIDNKPSFIKAADERNLINQFRSSVSVSKRVNAFAFHVGRATYYSAFADDFIVKELNPNFFLNGDNRIAFLKLEYHFTYNKLIYPLYPEGGYNLQFFIKKEGFSKRSNLRNTAFFIHLEKHAKPSEKVILSTRLKMKANLERNQIPYFFNNALGYEGNNLIGYQLYVVDGTDFVIHNNAFKYRIFQKDFNFKKWVPKSFRPFNTKVYFRLNADYGYVNEPFYTFQNPLSNTFLVGYGGAIDIILFHNFILAIDYSFNKEGDQGLFFSGGLQF